MREREANSRYLRWTMMPTLVQVYVTVNGA
jgi:hypothetical protein